MATGGQANIHKIAAEKAIEKPTKTPLDNYILRVFPKFQLILTAEAEENLVELILPFINIFRSKY